jgi:hypothetical protein
MHNFIAQPFSEISLFFKTSKKILNKNYCCYCFGWNTAKVGVKNQSVNQLFLKANRLLVIDLRMRLWALTFCIKTMTSIICIQYFFTCFKKQRYFRKRLSYKIVHLFFDYFLYRRNNWLTDWFLTPTLAVFQLPGYRGLSETIDNWYIDYFQNVEDEMLMVQIAFCCF